MKAINPKHQPLVNKVLKLNASYEQANEQRNVIESSDSKQSDIDRVNRLCESRFDKFIELHSELPIRERKNLSKILLID